MIQRIQSVYLAVAAVIGLVYFFLPISTVNVGDTLYVVKASGIYYQEGGNLIFDAPVLTLSSVLLFQILLSAITIFQFKNRGLQVKLTNLNLALVVACIALTFLYADSTPEKVEEGMNFAVTYSYGSIAPLISLISVFLARTAILKDDKLVKSLDRLR